MAMKVGIIGAGGVGSACLYAMALRGSAREIVVANRDAKRASGTIRDLQYGTLLTPAVAIRAGDVEELRDCAAIVITIGLNEQRGGATDRNDAAGRLRLLEKNAEIYRDIVPKLAAAAPGAILLVVTDPPDALADVARAAAPRSRVISAGTFLDTLRFRFHLAQHLGVDARSVDAMVIGEHGTSQVFVWSLARVAGTPVIPALLPKTMGAETFRERIEEEVRFANIGIIEGTGASRLGIGVAVARIVEMILRDEKAVIPIGSYQERFGVTMSLPSVVGRNGIERVMPLALSMEEEGALRRSADVLKAAQRSAT
ncbi:MAG TPA: NAD(P)-binding domain-containing protein [Usitatibacter sp.]|nr:NAD(P)-binding domain-containing protein [Usitatibacter sp.]